MTEPVGNDAPQVLNTELPQNVTISTFVVARIKEVETMRKSIKKSTSVKMAFQKLPQHMRRRAMAHEVKRLPRRLREIHANQMKKSGLPPKSKRPSRKFRRRPYNLLSDYARRRRRIKWLNTHIWHAKRFVMVEKWGYKLPYYPCDKSFRACYRATTQHCLLQDISYQRVIEISGTYLFLVSRLCKLTDSNTGLSFGAKCFSEGKKYGKITVFRPGSKNLKHRKAVGQVDFFWSSICDDDCTSLWIFVHPAFYKELIDIFIALFELQLLSMDVENDKESKNEDPVYAGLEGVILKELEFELSRLRLTGPLSTAVLKNALKPVNFDEIKDLPTWCKNYKMEKLSEQNILFKNHSNDNALPPNLVFSLVVHDPRMILPKKPTKSMPNFGVIGDIEPYQKNISLSPLWSPDVRQYVKENKVSNQEISEMRSDLLVPGSDLNVPGEMVPIILMWRGGSRMGRCTGWDVIVPSSWTQYFFISFNMWGGRAGGIRETESHAFEESQVDILFPDTLAGEQEEKFQSDEGKEKFFRLPPNKRTNYIKFAMVSPFKCPWSLLVKEWSDSDFFVLRDRRLLQNIKEFLSNKQKSSQWNSIPEDCLVSVQVLPLKKGCCTKFAEICFPTEADLKEEPLEPRRKDPNVKKRNQMRKAHKLLLRRLMKRRKRAKKSGKPVLKTDVTLLETYKMKMRNLWLPECTNIKDSCSRQVMGFVIQGGFCYSLGRSKGLGYIVGASLNLLVQNTVKNKVLVRNTNSRQYRVALLDILIE